MKTVSILNSRENLVPNPISNQRGQTLIEYIIIVGLVGVASIVLMRSVGQQLNSNFAKVVYALGGKVDETPEGAVVSKGSYSKKDMKSFLNSAREDRNGKSNDQGARE